jgi:hypothetical protein
MIRFQIRLLAACLGTYLAFTSLSSAQAAFHLWKIDEVYSNASGTVQFIEMDASTNSGQQFTTGTSLTVSSASGSNHTYTFPGSLPGDTANHHYLFATPGYVALTNSNPSLPKADVTLPANNFFNINGDTINYANVTTFTFSTGQLPTNGFDSLNRTYAPGSTITVGTNTPLNFTNATSSLAPPTGDLNLDSHVNASDISSLMSALTGPASFATSAGLSASQLTTVGDVNGDTTLNLADLQKLLIKLKTGGGSLASVPEPSSCILAALVAGLLWRSRRRFKIDLAGN